MFDEEWVDDVENPWHCDQHGRRGRRGRHQPPADGHHLAASVVFHWNRHSPNTKAAAMAKHSAGMYRRAEKAPAALGIDDRGRLLRPEHEPGRRQPARRPRHRHDQCRDQQDVEGEETKATTIDAGSPPRPVRRNSRRCWTWRYSVGWPSPASESAASGGASS